jgi:hypothetical protein
MDYRLRASGAFTPGNVRNIFTPSFFYAFSAAHSLWLLSG